MWAYEYEAGKFIAGEILGDTLYMYAPTGRGEKWVMNSEGFVLEYSSEPFHKSDEIIAGINAHYGTSFYQEDDIDKDFTIGDTVPNWNAYEKIELPIDQKLAIGMNGNSVFSIGRLIGTEFYITVKAANQGYWTNNEGRITSLGGPTSEAGAEYVKGLLENKGYAISEIKDNIVQYEVGDIIEDWNSYEILMQ